MKWDRDNLISGWWGWGGGGLQEMEEWACWMDWGWLQSRLMVWEGQPVYVGRPRPDLNLVFDTAVRSANVHSSVGERTKDRVREWATKSKEENLGEMAPRTLGGEFEDESSRKLWRSAAEGSRKKLTKSFSTCHKWDGTNDLSWSSSHWHFFY